MRICSVIGCGEKHKGNGYCDKHNFQMKYYGKILERTKFDKNEFNIETNILKIKLYNNKNIVVGEGLCDLIYETEVRKYKWYLDKGYVATTLLDGNGRHKGLLHQLIIQLSGKVVQPGEEIDHKDGNPLNCLDNNLRICTHSQNNHNQKLSSNNTSGWKGVCWSKQNQKWQAYITVGGKQIHLGFFSIKEDAARAYNVAAIKYFGEFAVLNKI